MARGGWHRLWAHRSYTANFPYRFVVMIFMALKWDNKVNATILAVGALCVVIFISFILIDTEFRGDLSNTTEGTIMDQQRMEATMDGREPDRSDISFNRQ